MIFLLYFCLLLFLPIYGDIYNNEIEKCNLSNELVSEIQNYQPIANKIIDVVLNGEYKNMTYKHLAEFVDKFGNRMAGTENLENAIDYMLEKLKDVYLENVHSEEVVIPNWIR